jgi:deoxyribodipyrimidine photo-lyase
MNDRATIVWLRSDLRLHDNPALEAAAARGGPVLPVFVLDDESRGGWPLGAASRWWLHRSLGALAAELEASGSRLLLRRGDPLAALCDLTRETGAGAVYWNRRYEPATRRYDAQVKEELTGLGVEANSFKGALLFEPWEIRTGSGDPYKVFTPFYKACMREGVPARQSAEPPELAPPGSWPESLPLEALALEPEHDWDAGLRATWTPGEPGAREALERFLAPSDEGVEAYGDRRDRPDLEGTSRLSPYLAFGEISPLAVWEAVRLRADFDPDAKRNGAGEAFLRQLIWREFAHHLLFHFPHTADEPLRPEFGAFPWHDDPAALRRWRRGRTGFPIVDAGMRQLWETGWMHNRVRMIVASFLVKDLLIPWQEGARWFWDTLVDADLANNTLGWQWTAGCGADAAPYFRVFNPMLQGKRFDPDGAYVRRYVPELAALPDRFVHEPWSAPEAVLDEAGLRLGSDYPKPMVDHGAARDRALRAYDTIRKGKR